VVAVLAVAAPITVVSAKRWGYEYRPDPLTLPFKNGDLILSKNRCSGHTIAIDADAQ